MESLAAVSGEELALTVYVPTVVAVKYTVAVEAPLAITTEVIALPPLDAA
jgi:hypothetical protein